jgi:hypothetical protein
MSLCSAMSRNKARFINRISLIKNTLKLAGTILILSVLVLFNAREKLLGVNKTH